MKLVMTKTLSLGFPHAYSIEMLTLHSFTLSDVSLLLSNVDIIICMLLNFGASSPERHFRMIKFWRK